MQTIGCASVGTFMTGLGIDLLINKQAGLSFGLRFLFDRNDSHVKVGGCSVVYLALADENDVDRKKRKLVCKLVPICDKF